jgi:hypothetical protein
MSALALLHHAPFDAPCTIEIEHSSASLHAHVAFDDDLEIGPGDRVRVLGAPIQVPFGEKLVLRRAARVERATWLKRIWTRLAARFELAELYEVSFSTRRSL